MPNSSRRFFVRSSSAAGAVLVLTPEMIARGAPKEAVAQKAMMKHPALRNRGFKVEIKGLYKSVPNVVSFDPGGIVFKPSAKGWVHGDHEYQDATLTVQQGPGMVKQQEWADKAMKMGGAGDALRRDISCYLLARDKSSTVRTVNLFGCYPVDFDAGDQGAGNSELKTITISLNVDRIEVT